MGKANDHPGAMTELGQALLVLAAAVLSCCAPGAPTIDVSVTGLGADIRSLRVTVTLNGSQHPTPPVLGDLSRFTLQLSADPAGPVGVRVGGLDAQGCRIAEGSAQVTLGPDRHGAAAVNLIPLAPDDRGCRLIVTASGDGHARVSDGDGKLSCALPAQDQCSASFLPGAQVTLKADPDIDSYLLGWTDSGGACTNPGPCTVAIGDEVARVQASLGPLRACTGSPGGSRWCWQNPLPQGWDLVALWAFSAQDVWAVGQGGAILRWNGAFWAPLPSGVSRDLDSVWGTGPNDVWVTGDQGTILRWNGSAFTYWTGSAFTPDPVLGRAAISFNAVRGTSPTDVWITGTQGALFHWDGTAFIGIPTGTTASLDFLWVGGPGDVWAVGQDGFVVHWDGTAVSTEVIAPGPQLTGVWGTGADLWAVGLTGTTGVILRRANGAWQTVQSTPAPMTGIWGTGPQDLWAVGVSTIWRGDGSSFHVLWDDSGPAPNILDFILGISGSGPDDVWFSGSAGRLLHWNGLQIADLDSGSHRDLFTVWANATDDVWAAGTNGTVLRWSGASWLPVAFGAGVVLTGLWGSGRGDLWVTGELGVIRHWDGQVFQVVPSFAAASDYDFSGAWGSGPDDVWFVGALYTNDGGTVAHWSGSSSITQGLKFTGAPLNSIWGSGPKDIWAVGGAGAVLHYDGTWHIVSVPARQRALFKVWGWPETQEVWIAGDEIILHGVGGTFTEVGQGITPGTKFYGIWGSSAEDVWLVDYSLQSATGGLVHWDGAMFTPVPGAPFYLSSVVGLGPDDIWAVGTGGGILKHRSK